MEMFRTTVNIPDSLKSRMDKWIRQMNRFSVPRWTQSDLIRQAVEMYLDDHRIESSMQERS